VETLLQTLNYLSLEGLASHAQDISHPLRRSVSYFGQLLHASPTYYNDNMHELQ
jgi:hypothetical protein